MPIDPAAIAKSDARIAGRLRAASLRLRSRVESSLDDVEAHASLGLTRAARAAPGGRATVAEIRRSRGYLAANRKLDSLATKLAEIIVAAREEAYLEARIGWAAAYPPAFVRPGATTATRGEVEHARRLVVGGAPLEDEAHGWAATAKAGLERAMVVASTPGGPGEAEPDELVSGWATSARSALLAAALGALEDGLRAVDRLAGRDCLVPSRLFPDPTLD